MVGSREWRRTAGDHRCTDACPERAEKSRGGERAEFSMQQHRCSGVDNSAIRLFKVCELNMTIMRSCRRNHSSEGNNSMLLRKDSSHGAILVANYNCSRFDMFPQTLISESQTVIRCCRELQFIRNQHVSMTDASMNRREECN